MGFFVGVDPSISNTGVVVLDSLGNVTGVYNSRQGSKRSSNESDIAFYMRRADDIAEYLRSATDGYVDAIGYEDYSYDSVHRGYSLAEYGGILKSRLMPLASPHLLAPGTVKKFATGNGLASKAMMKAAATKESRVLSDLPARQRTDDVCDAYFMARMAWYLAYIQQPEHLIHHEGNRALLRARLDAIQRLADR